MANLPPEEPGPPEGPGLSQHAQEPTSRRGGGRLKASFQPIVVIALGTVLASCRGDARDHIAWGDRFLGSDRPEAALAEYQVALRRRGDEADILLRLAHGYAQLDRLDEASGYYSRLLDIDSTYTDQAVADFLQMAQRARRREDRAGLARALEQVESLRPEAVPDDMSLPFARYYYELGEYASALPLYLAVYTDSVQPQVHYELARVYDELGECGHALARYLDYLAVRHRGELSADARWHAGHCAWELAERDRKDGRPTQALERLELLIELGAPQSLLDDAWYQRGELLFTLGRFEDATASYQQVLELNPSRTGRLVRSAEDRIRAIRYRSEP